MSFQTIVRSLSKQLLSFVLLATLVACIAAPTLQGQDAVERRVKSRVTPTYPDLARKMSLVGVVKIAVVVAPNGSVKETKVIGGNPILVNAALDAVKKWKFEAASDESTGVIEFKFDPTVAN